MSTSLRFSIIINTYNRAGYLEKLLPAFHHLAYDQFEVIVVNGPSTDDTAALLENYEGLIKVVDCPVAHMTRSRNLGLEAAAGDIVVFIDDDARPAEATWLNEIGHIFQQDTAEQIGAIGGPVFHRDAPYFQFKGGLVSDYCHQVFWEQDRGDIIPDGQRWTQRSMGCNSAFRRSALLEIGGFDENITYYSDEGDVCLRLARRGYRVVQPENCAVRHYPAPSQHLGTPFLRNRRVITKDDTYFCLKNGLDGPVKRLFKTLWLAPTKHFFREMPQYWRNGQISLSQLLSFFGWQWLQGLLTGLWLGMFKPRRLEFETEKGLSFVPFTKNKPEQKLNICLLSESLPPNPLKAGGIAHYTLDLAYGLHELGHQVHIITRSDQSIRRDSLGLTIHGIPDNQIQTSLFPSRPTLNKLSGYSLAVYHKLLELLYEGYQVDVVETPNWGVEGLALALSGLFPLVLRIHTPLIQAIQSGGWPLNEDMQACVAVEKWLIEYVEALTASTTGVIETSRELMDIQVDRLPYFKQVPLGLKPTYTTEAIAPAAARKRLLYVGRFEHRKGTHVLLEILPQLMAEFEDWECYLVGPNDGYWGQKWLKEFRTEARGRPWERRVYFTGAVNDEVLQGYYKNCDLFVAPSLYESFGIIYMEAMQYGKAVVGCQVGGIPEVVTDGEDGLLVEPDSGPVLHKALAQLMADDELRQRLGRRGLQKMQQKFSHLTMAEGMVAVYRAAITTRKRMAQVRLHYLGPQGHSSDQVNLQGSWRRKLSSRSAYLYSDEAGDSVQITGLRGGCTVEIAALCHTGAGVVAVTANSMPPVFFDLFHSPHQRERRFRMQVPRSTSLAEIQLTIHPERNPASSNSEVWLKYVVLYEHIDPSTLSDKL